VDIERTIYEEEHGKRGGSGHLKYILKYFENYLFTKNVIKN
jgi:hypothetical protein